MSLLGISSRSKLLAYGTLVKIRGREAKVKQIKGPMGLYYLLYMLVAFILIIISIFNSSYILMCSGGGGLSQLNQLNVLETKFNAYKVGANTQNIIL